MRVTIRHEDKDAADVLLVRDSAGLVVEVPPGKARSVPLAAGLTVEVGRKFPGWAAWSAEHDPPPPVGDPNLPPISGRS